MAFNNLLTETAHRPWPLPDRPWVITQTWHTLLFAHWPIPTDVLRPHIPQELEIDTYDGQAWIGVVPFRMSHIRPRYLPPAPWLSFFPELNVRTYVTDGEKAGVWFFSLEAANPLAVAIARRWFHLPYFNARMRCDLNTRTHEVSYNSVRTHRGAPPAKFIGSYRPTNAVYNTEDGTLEAWFTERYCLYASDREKTLYRGEIHHIRWPLQTADVAIAENTMSEAAGIHLPDVEPLLHYAHRIRVLIWPLEEIAI